MNKDPKKDWNSAVASEIERWLADEKTSYFDIRYFLCSFDLGLYFLLTGKFCFFFQKLKSLGRPNIRVDYQDEENPTPINSIAIAVTFNPDHQVLGNLRRLTEQFNHVIIVDNTPQSALTFLLTEAALNSSRVTILSNQNRDGISGALNKGIRELYRKQKNGWVFWFDQDTEIHPDFMIRVNAILAKYPTIENQKSLFGVNYEDGKTLPRVLPFEMLEVRTIITSGSFTRIENLKRLGLCIDELFIDSVDHEYCLRAKRMGMKIKWITIPLMKHSLGRIEVRSLLWKKDVIVTNHAPFRWFYFSRNHILTCFDGFPWSFRWFLKHGYSLLKNYLKVLLLEEEKWRKTTGIFAGIFSGLLLIFGIDRRYSGKK
jgi:rhamnosyltransferase